MKNTYHLSKEKSPTKEITSFYIQVKRNHKKIFSTTRLNLKDAIETLHYLKIKHN